MCKLIIPLWTNGPITSLVFYVCHHGVCRWRQLEPPDFKKLGGACPLSVLHSHPIHIGANVIGDKMKLPGQHVQEHRRAVFPVVVDQMADIGRVGETIVVKIKTTHSNDWLRKRASQAGLNDVVGWETRHSGVVAEIFGHVKGGRGSVTHYKNNWCAFKFRPVKGCERHDLTRRT